MVKDLKNLLLSYWLASHKNKILYLCNRQPSLELKEAVGV
jgi:hypothetical protein